MNDLPISNGGTAKPKSAMKVAYDCFIGLWAALAMIFGTVAIGNFIGDALHRPTRPHFEEPPLEMTYDCGLVLSAPQLNNWCWR